MAAIGDPGTGRARGRCRREAIKTDSQAYTAGEMEYRNVTGEFGPESGAVLSWGHTQLDFAALLKNQWAGFDPGMTPAMENGLFRAFE